MGGRYDLTIHEPGLTYPSWIDLDARLFCGQWGSARRVPTLVADADHARWTLPKQYEARESDLVFDGAFDPDGTLRGTMTAPDGSLVPFEGLPAPELPHRDVTWGEPTALIGEGLDGWTERDDRGSNWSVAEDGLVNSAVGADLVTIRTFEDFRLTAHYVLPAGSNSGIYLRGRYEFQILDDIGQAPHVGGSGAIYGLIVPTANAVRAAGEVNKVVIELVGRFVSVDFNGTRVIERGEIAGPTGGALDSDEGAAGPIFVQGDHGPVTFRRLDIQEAL